MNKKLKTYFSRILIVVLAISCLISCQSVDDQSKDLAPLKYTDHKLLQLKGGVKSMRIWVFKGKDSLQTNEYFLFNKRGLLIEKEFDVFNTRVVSQYKYNTKGERTEVKRIENGKTVSIDRWIDSLGEDNRLVKRDGYNLNNQLVSETNFSYSSKGNLIAREVLGDKGEIHFIDSFFYNAKNERIREDLLRFDAGYIQDLRILTYYNSIGKKKMEIVYLGENEFEGKETWSYDSLGRLVDHIIYNRDTNLYKRSQVVYNKEGYKTDSIFQIFNSNDIENEPAKEYEAHLFEYKDQGKLQKVVLRREGEVFHSTVFYYNERDLLEKKEISYSDGFVKTFFDEMGFETSVLYFDKNKVLTRKNQNKMKYDSEGNFIEAKVFEDGELKRAVKREFEYF